MLRDADAVDNIAATVRGYRDAAGGTDNAFGFAIATTSITGLADRITINGFGEVYMGSTIAGAQAAGPLKVGITTPDNGTPYQAILGQMVNGTYTPGSITLANDKVAVAGGAYRGAGGTSPIYAGRVSDRLHHDRRGERRRDRRAQHVGHERSGQWPLDQWQRQPSRQRDPHRHAGRVQVGRGHQVYRGQHRACGATGSILNYGIIFDKSQDQDFLVIRPRVGVTTNRAIRITNPAFSGNVFEVWNDGTISTTGNIQTTGNIGAVQYFASGLPGGSVTKTLGACTLTFTGGILTGFTGPGTC